MSPRLIPLRRNMGDGRLDQRARCAVSVKANWTAARCASVRVARKALAAATAAAAVLLDPVRFLWAEAEVAAGNGQTVWTAGPTGARRGGSAAPVRRVALFKGTPLPRA